MAEEKVHEAVQGIYSGVLAFSTAVADRRAALLAGDAAAANAAGDAGTDAWMKRISANLKKLVDIIEAHESAAEARNAESVVS